MNLLSHLPSFAPATRATVLRRIVALAIGLLAALPASAANYTWNNSGSDWATGASWTPSGPPTASDGAFFNPSSATASNSLINSLVNPNIGSSQSALSLGLANNPALGNYIFTGANPLTLGGTSSTGITARGYGATIFNGPGITGTGASGTNLANFTVTTDAGLTLAGASAATSNVGQISNFGGTLTLDNTGTNTLSRLPTTNTIVMNGGSFFLLGNSAGSVVNVGILNVSAAATTPGEGFVTIGVTVPSGATSGSTLNFANSAAFSLRTTTGLAYNFVGAGGVLGSAGGPRITFTTAPTITTTTGTGMIDGSTTVTSSTVGFAIATDSSGTGWATYVTPAGSGATATGGIEILSPSTTATTAANLQALTAASVADFTPAASSTTSLTALSQTGSIRIAPAGSGATLALGANNLKTNGILLTGSNDFTITATSGNLDGTATKNIFVANPATTLSIGGNLAGAGSNGNPVNINGPGFVALTGGSNQFNVTGTNRFNLIGGTLRGNTTNAGGFGSAGGTGVIAFRGGVLEITNGADGSGSSADFTRIINNTNTAGETNWASSTGGDSQGGGGGFSAFGAAASVNLGGSATPSTLTWGVASSGFVQDGESLTFGSTKSNARLDFLNNLALDGGTAGTYNVREVNVIGGAGGDATRFTGVISGSSSTDLEKTGSGTLQLAGANTFAGNTLVFGGTVALVGSGTLGAGNLTLANGSTFDISGNTSNVVLTSFQTLSGNGTLKTGSNTLTLNGNLSPLLGSNALTLNGLLTENGFTNFLLNGTSNSTITQIALLTGSTLNFGTSTINVNVNYTPALNDTIDLVSLGGSATISGNPTFVFSGTSLPGGLFWNTSNFDTTGSIVAASLAIPEPGSFAIGLGAAALAVAAWRRTRRIA